MAGKSRLSIAKSDIVRLFRDAPRKIYTTSDMARILSQNRGAWRLAWATTADHFIRFLLETTDLRQERIAFPYRPLTRFTWGDVDTYSIIQSINIDGYFTHYSAMHFHGLTEQLPNAVYFNQEQRATGGGGKLTQAGIGNAFRGRCRVTSNVASFRERSIHLLNGQNTGQLGVIATDLADGSHIRLTNIERSLIDAAVRPVYSGGVFEVAKAFARAHGQLSVNKLVATLRHLHFTYPYHQSIGFYLERTGLYPASHLDLLRNLPIKFDFYLDYGMESPDYDAGWRLFVPKGF